MGSIKRDPGVTGRWWRRWARGGIRLAEHTDGSCERQTMCCNAGLLAGKVP